MWTPIKSFIGPTFEAPSTFVDSERVVNLIPILNESGNGGREDITVSWTNTPGLTLEYTFPAPIRGMHMTSIGILAVVAGNKCYRYNSSTSVVEVFELNTSTGTVYMADDGTGLVVSDSTYGYYFNFASSTMTPITGDAWLGTYNVDFIDGYFLFAVNTPGTLSPTLYYGADPLNLDPLDYNILEETSDKIVTFLVERNSVWVFKQRSSLAFYNTSSAEGNLFQPVGGSHVNIGCVSRDTVQTIDNMIVWLGQSYEGGPIVYMSSGSLQGQRISNAYLESKLRKLTQAQLGSATAHAYGLNGKHYYCLNVDGLGSTWVYDLSTQLWVEKAEWVEESGSYTKDRVQYACFAYGKVYGSDWENGKMYVLNPESPYYDAAPTRWVRRTGHTTNDGKRVAFHGARLDFEVGRGLPDYSTTTTHTMIGDEMFISFSWSDNVGRTWSNRQLGLGAIGEVERRVITRKLGNGRDRIWEISGYGPVIVNLVGLYVDATPLEA